MERGLTLLVIGIFFGILYFVLYCKAGKIKVSILDTFSVIALVVTVLYFVYQMWLR